MKKLALVAFHVYKRNLSLSYYLVCSCLFIFIFYQHFYYVFIGTQSCFPKKLFESYLIRYLYYWQWAKLRSFLILLLYFIIHISHIHYTCILFLSPQVEKMNQSGTTVVDFEGCLTPSIRNNLNPLPWIKLVS